MKKQTKKTKLKTKTTRYVLKSRMEPVTFSELRYEFKTPAPHNFFTQLSYKLKQFFNFKG
jgi:hypothetical protein